MIYNEGTWNTGDNELDAVLNISENYTEYVARVGKVNALMEGPWVANTIQTFKQLSPEDRLERAKWLKGGAKK